jgi:ubiquitin carboxyl-terminal hydrolase 25
MKQALLIIAEDRQSARLKAFVETGQDCMESFTVSRAKLTLRLVAIAAGPPPPDSARADWPRGLQQLGNTCYLNSLLQVRSSSFSM